MHSGVDEHSCWNQSCHFSAETRRAESGRLGQADAAGCGEFSRISFLPMPSYLWIAKNSSGQEVTERVIAESPEEAQNLLLDRGWTNLRLQSSEIHEFIKREIDAVSDPNYRPDLTPEQEAAYIQEAPPGFWANWWKTTRQSAGTFLILAVWFAWSVYRKKLMELFFRVVCSLRSRCCFRHSISGLVERPSFSKSCTRRATGEGGMRFLLAWKALREHKSLGG